MANEPNEGWKNVGRIHTIPHNDIAEHSLSADCACGPKFEMAGDEGWDIVQHVIHNAFDGRDFSERAIPDDGLKVIQGGEDVSG